MARRTDSMDEPDAFALGFATKAGGKGPMVADHRAGTGKDSTGC